MLGEDLTFKAKSFLKVYKDSLVCMRQTAQKQAWEQKAQIFEKMLSKSLSQGEVVMNKDGDLEKGLKEGIFFRYSQLCDQHIGLKLTEYSNLNMFQQLEKITTDLKVSIDKERLLSSSSSSH